MVSLLVIGAASFYLFRLLGGAPMLHLRQSPRNTTNAAKVEELTEYASRLRAGNKYTAAEKVYLQVLKIDHQHVSTYSRLGTLYSAQKKHGDAIECFIVTTQLKPSGSTYYNLGLAYFENRNYMKAIAAFEKAVMFEPTTQRYVGLAKAFKKLDDQPRMIGALEQAAQLEPSVKVLWLLADAYQAAGRIEDVAAVYERIRELDPGDARLEQAPHPIKA